WGAVPAATIFFGFELLKDGDWIPGSATVLISLGALWLVDRQMRRTADTRFTIPRSPLGIFALLAIVTWGAVIYEIYDRHYFSPVSDVRLAPFGKNSTFFAGLPYDTTQSFKMICFTYDPDESCSIAAKYRDRLANHWTPGETFYDAHDPPNF